MPDYDVAITGGGIGGLSAALCLGAQGFRVGVFERQSGPVEAGAGIQLAANATRVLEAVGVLPELLEKAAEPEEILVRDGKSGALLAGIPLGGHARARYGARYLTIHRADLHDTLHRAASGHRLIEITHSAEITALEDQSHEVIVSDARGRGFSAGIGVIADGVWSRLRQTHTGTGPAIFTGENGWRALVPVRDAGIAAGAAHTGLWTAPGGHLVHYPVSSGDLINVVAVTSGHQLPTGWGACADAGTLGAAFADWAVPCRDLIAAAPEWRVWSLHRREPDAWWSRGRITLLGDAAHPMRPYLAQGAAMAIEDGYVLAACLTRDSTAPARALKEYENRRLRRTTRVQRASSANAATFHASGLHRLARNAALTIAGRLSPGHLLARYDWLHGYDVTKEPG